MEDELKMVSVVNGVEVVVDDVCNCTVQQFLVVIADGDGDFHLLNFYWMIGWY